MKTNYDAERGTYTFSLSIAQELLSDPQFNAQALIAKAAEHWLTKVRAAA